MGKENYADIVAKALVFMKANIPKQISVEDIAKATFYSSDHLRRVFRVVTSEGVLPNLIRLRIEKAKELLVNSKLTIDEIADSVGFVNYRSFYKTFNKKVGMSPSAFAENARKLKEFPLSEKKSDSRFAAQTWFKDSFESRELEIWWKPIEGEWSQQDGELTGKSHWNMLLGLDKLLPENFRLSFSFIALPDVGIEPSDFIMSLWDENFKQPYCGFVAGAINNTNGELRHRGVGIQWNHEAVIKSNTWQKACMEIKEDVLRFFLDNTEIFGFQEPFSPPYSVRSKFAITGEHSSFKIKDFIIEDLGFTSLSRSIKQGDMLYNNGLYDRANEFYGRYLSAAASDAETVELRYKMGMCSLRMGGYSQARTWFDKVLPLPENSYWKNHARIAELELFFLEGNYDDFVRHARDLFANADLRDKVREILHYYAEIMDQRGFYQQAIIFLNMPFTLDDKNNWPSIWAGHQIAHYYEQMHDLQSAALCMDEILKSPHVPKSRLFYLMMDRLTIYSLQGKFEESDKELRCTLKNASKFDVKIIANLNLAFNLRGRNKLKGALEILKTAVEHNDVSLELSFARVEAAFMLHLLGEKKEAKMIATASPLLGIDDDKKALLLYAFDVMEGNYEKATDLLIERFRQGEYAIHARQAVTAGILLELASYKTKGKTPSPDEKSFPRYHNISQMLYFEARKIWSEAMRRFPPERVNFYASLAEAFLNGTEDHLEEMPYPAWNRSEMFYLCGLLYKGRGNEKRAEELFQLSVEDDRTLRWPAYLAAKKLKKD